MAIVKEVDLKVNSKQAEKNLSNVNEQLEIQKDVLFELEKQLFEVEEARKKTSKTNLAAQKKLAAQSEKIKTSIQQEKFGLKELNNEKRKSTKVQKDITESTKESALATSGLTGVVDKYTGGAVSGFKNMLTSVKATIKGMNLLKVAVIGTGIGALVIGILSLVQAFKRSEEGQNKFAKILAVIGSVADNVLDVFANLGGGIISAFENPKKAITDFAKLIKDNIVTRFQGLLNLIPSLSKAVTELFKGNFSSAGKIAADAVGKVALGVDSVTDSFSGAIEKVKEFSAEVSKDAQDAAKIADKRANAEKILRGLIVERAEADRKIAELREKAADKENVSIDDRITALNEASKISEEITNKEIAAAKLLYDAKVKENSLAKSTKEDLEEEAQLKANLTILETERLKKQKSLTAEITTAKREAKAEEKRIEDEKISDEKERVALRKEIADAEANTIEEKRLLALEKEKARFDELILRATEEGLSTEELERTQKERLAEMRAGFAKEDKAADDKIIRDKKAKADEEFRIEQALVAQKKALQQANLNNLANGFALLGKLAGKNKALQAAAIIGESAVGIARTIIETQTSNAATTAQGAALAIPTAGASVAAAASLVTANNIGAGIGIATNIAATAKALSGLKAGGSPPPKGNNPSTPKVSAPSIEPPKTESLPPAFNVVGASNTSQLADAIGGQSQQPIQTYVVSSDVTTAQEMERNIVTGASI